MSRNPPSTHFELRCKLPCSAKEAFAWHERPGAFNRLNPPWDPVRVLEHVGGIKDGARVTIEVPLGPIPMRWTLEHRDYQKDVQFKDVQIRGPFASYAHTHRFHSAPPGDCILEDSIDYRLPFAPFGDLFGSAFTKAKLEGLFKYRHRITTDDLKAHSQFAAAPRQTILVSGSSGLVGSQLVPYLSTAGHTVKRLVRKDQSKDPNEICWDPKVRVLFPSLTGIDAVVHLAGDGIANGRWTKAKKARIRDSRIQGTRTLCESLIALTPRPKVLICASAIGIYGNRGEELLTENSTHGDGFLAEVTKEWEEASQIAIDAGIRVVHLRFGVVLSPAGGALQKMLPPFRLGLGGKLGDGAHWMSWIALDDVLGLIEHAIHTEQLYGGLNAVAPVPITNADFTSCLGTVLKRPTPFTVPRIAAELAFGEIAKEALFSSARVSAGKAEASGYSFRFPKLEQALRHVLGK